MAGSLSRCRSASIMLSLSLSLQENTLFYCYEYILMTLFFCMIDVLGFFPQLKQSNERDYDWLLTDASLDAQSASHKSAPSLTLSLRLSLQLNIFYDY